MKKLITIMLLAIVTIGFTQTRVMINFTEILEDVDSDNMATSKKFNDDDNTFVVTYSEFDVIITYYFDKPFNTNPFCNKTLVQTTDPTKFNKFVLGIRENDLFVPVTDSTWYYYTKQMKVNTYLNIDNDVYEVIFER